MRQKAKSKEKKPKLKIGDKVKIIKIDNLTDEEEKLDATPLLNCIGMVRCFEGEKDKMIGIDLGTEFKGITHNLNDVLTKKTGIFIEDDDYELEFTYSSGNESKDYFVISMLTKHFKELQELPNVIRSKKSEVTYRLDRIKVMEEDIKNYQKEIEIIKKNIDILESKTNDFDYAKFEKLFDNIIKHPLIKDLTYEKETLICTTEDLTYHETKNRDREVPDYNLGAYKIFIPLSETSDVKACNIKRQIQRYNLHHPCISDFRICMGETLAREIRKLRGENNIAQVIFLLIQFFQEPNYGTPYINTEYFQFAQPVTIKPKKELDWLSFSVWEKEIWDATKYSNDKSNWDSNVF